MKVAIIGSGASGLTAIKCCIDEGIQPVCFERTDYIGGLWNYSPGVKEGSTVYRSTVINTSKEMMCYSDFPIPKEFPNFMHNTKVLEYFNLYAARFKLRDHIRFNTRVLSCKQADGFPRNGQWKVHTKNENSGQEKSEYYDGVLVCIGHHAIPHYPLKEFKGIDDFKGKCMHSHEYRDQRGFEDKRVLVIGIGNSGGDVAVELGKYSKEVYLSTRRGAWILGRVQHGGLPLDISFTNRFNSFFQFLLPPSILQKMAEKQLKEKMDHEKYGLKPKHPLFAQHPNVNDEMPNRILSGEIRIKGNVARFKENSVVFDDGTEEEVDVVIFATGYSFEFPFLDQSVLKVVDNECDLYKYVWPTTLPRHTLAIIGGIQPLGAVNPISEMQCRWATRVIKGDAVLPSADEMMKDVVTKRKTMGKRYVKSRRHTIQVDYQVYMDELADQISCKPNLLKYLLSDPALALKLWFGPIVPYQYRLDGPGKWPEARKCIMTVMDRVWFPLQTRKVDKSEGASSSFAVYIFLTLLAVFLAWYFQFF